MPDVQANIILNTTGGDASASEINKARQGLENVTSASSGLEHQFQHRFQHIGLMLFAGDALRASGLGAETRQVIGGLNTALIAGESAFGAAAGPAFLFVAALTAVAGIAIKLTEHHKDLADSLDKVVKSQQDAYTKTEEDIAVLEKFNEVVGGAGGLLASEKALADLQQGELLSSQHQQVDAIRVLMESNVTHARVLSLLEDAYQKFLQVFESSLRRVLEAIPGVGALVSIYELLKDRIGQVTGALHLHGIQYDINSAEAQKLADKNTALKVKLDELILSINLGGQAWKKYATDANAAWLETAAAMDNTQTEYEKDMAKNEEDTRKTLEEMTKEWDKHCEEVSNKVGTRIGADFGSMLSGVLFQTQTVTEAMNQLWQRMVSQFITYVAEMIAKWIALKIVMGVASVGASEGAFAAMNAGAGPAALGGSYYADKPTMIMFGEAGPEVATFTPMGGSSSSSGGGGGGGDTYNITLTMNANGVTDPDTLARQMGQKLSQMIRGQGQIGMLRA